MTARVISVHLGEKRSGPGSEGWPHTLTFELADGQTVEAVLADEREYSELARVVEQLNRQLDFKPGPAPDQELSG